MTGVGIPDRVSVAGVGSTGYFRTNGRTARSYALEAAIAAIRDAGLTADDIDGVIASPGMGSTTILPPSAPELTASLRLPNVTHFGEGNPVIVGPLIDAMNAIHSGACTTVLVYHYNYRTPFNSGRLASDPYRRHIRGYNSAPPEAVHDAVAYAAWASRYLHDHAVPREALGLVAVNSRSNAMRNPLAAMREPLTLDDYLAGRMVRDPFGMYDMDLPVDGAEAFVLTTTERARDLRRPPVLVRAAAQGLVASASDEEQLPSLEHHGQDVVVGRLRQQADIGVDDIDLAYVYDGFTFITLSWLEKLGWCDSGGAADYLRSNWDAAGSRLLLDGRVPVNLQGGMLSEGGTQGAGFVRDAVQQLRGAAGDRQVHGARTALLAIGGFFYNSQGLVLTVDPTSKGDHR